MAKKKSITRRQMMKYSAAGAAGIAVGTKALGQAAAVCVDAQPVDITAPLASGGTMDFTGCGYNEVFPASPFILDPFTQPLPVPGALAPGWRYPDGTLAAPGDPNAWFVRKSAQFGDNTIVPPGAGPGQQDALGDRAANPGLVGPGVLPNAGTHQLYPGGLGSSYALLAGQAKAAFDALATNPVMYHIRLQVSGHRVTNSRVVNIDKAGNLAPLPGGAFPTPAGTATFKGAPAPAYVIPESTIYGFNGTFPGPMVNAEYGKPALIRFENDLDLNPGCRDRQDFGAPDWAFLTHLHNGHTAPESDGNPNHLTDHEGGYQPMEWSDNLYLMYAAGGDEAEKQSFLWFHDHRMHHTGPNVYKGMVGLMPHYDPVIDPGEETLGLRLPGQRVDKAGNPLAAGQYDADGSFNVKYDIPIALYDCCLDDGVTSHQDSHTPLSPGDPRLPGNICGALHPEWWGRLFLKHFPNHGFVGDVFTVNGVAYPVHTVERRKYRFRFLGASLARCYDLSFRQGTPVPAPGVQGQWVFGNVNRRNQVTFNQGQRVFDMIQIASEGGLLPTAIKRDSIEIWPAKRREVIVDFSVYQNGQPTKTGDVFYLTNTMQMLDGRKPTTAGDPGFNNAFACPLVKFIIDGLPLTPDNSLMPVVGVTPLRPAPLFNAARLADRTFTLQRGGAAPSPETEWLINNMEFNPLAPLALPRIGSEEAWNINNGGGGWTHPMHIHMEEHHVVFRSTNLAKHIDDVGKEDVVALEPSEQTRIVRRFRTFLGNYVAHCHNLAHEDHNMMFGWTIVP